MSFVYSSEWRYSYYRDGAFVPGRTDSVSTLTSGWLLRLQYATSRTSSTIYRVSFFVGLLGTGLAAVGPSVISVSTWTDSEYSPLVIANLTLTGSLTGDSNSPTVQASRRALDVVRSERTFAESYGFELDAGIFANYLIPWPAQSWTRLLPPWINFTYATDVMRFAHDCHYYEPIWATANGAQSALFDGASVWTVPAFPGHTWSPWVVSEIPTTTMSGLFPLTESIANNGHGISAFLLLGANASESQPSAIDLSDVPSLYTASGFPLHTSQATTSSSVNLSKHASLLVCDPYLSISAEEVTVGSDAVLSLTSKRPGVPVLGNILHSAAATLFSQALTYTIQADEYIMSNTTFLNLDAVELFMGRTMNFDPQRANVTPSDASYIGGQMDRFMLSAAKAYLDGFVGLSNPETRTTMPATRSLETERFMTSSPFLIATCVLVGCIAVLLTFAANHRSARAREPLSMDALLKLRDEDLSLPLVHRVN